VTRRYLTVKRIKPAYSKIRPKYKEYLRLLYEKRYFSAGWLRLADNYFHAIDRRYLIRNSKIISMIERIIDLLMFLPFNLPSTFFTILVVIPYLAFLLMFMLTWLLIYYSCILTRICILCYIDGKDAGNKLTIGILKGKL
jgi:hypothetical protein